VVPARSTSVWLLAAECERPSLKRRVYDAVQESDPTAIQENRIGKSRTLIERDFDLPVRAMRYPKLQAKARERENDVRQRENRKGSARQLAQKAGFYDTICKSRRGLLTISFETAESRLIDSSCHGSVPPVKLMEGLEQW
jgi:hypothetical protein